MYMYGGDPDDSDTKIMRLLSATVTVVCFPLGPLEQIVTVC